MHVCLRILLLFSLFFHGCLGTSEEGEAFVQDKGKLLTDDFCKKLIKILLLLKEKTGVHMIVVTQTEISENPSGAHDYLKHYSRKNPDLPGVVYVVWHHDHSRLDIVPSDSLKVKGQLDVIFLDFDSKANTLGLEVALKSVVMSLADAIAHQFKVDFMEIIRKSYPDYDNLDSPVKAYKTSNEKK